MYFDLLALVDASVSALNVAKITKDYVAIEAMLHMTLMSI